MDGIEVEIQKIRNTPFIQKRMEQGTADYSMFTERPDLVEMRISREPGKIIETKISGKEENKWEFYDTGRWSLSLAGDASFGVPEGDRFGINSRRVLATYPHLKEVFAKRREELMETIDRRTVKALSKNFTLEEDNRKLLAMLKKSLEFAETVRNSGIGKIFFGRKAKELLGDKAKEAKRLLEKNDRGEK